MNTARHEQGTRTLWWGVVAWATLSVVAVMLYGPMWDESYEHAQVLRGDIPYPAGHPMKQYMFGAYTVQHYITAALMHLTSSPVLICGYRNALSLAMTTVPLFLLTAALSGRAAFGHVAVIAGVFGAFMPFASTYPLVMWWSTYSNGQIGQGLALLVLAILCMRRWRTAALIGGLFPAVHLGHFPPVAGVLLVAAGVAWWRGERAELAKCAGIFAAGLAACAAFAVVQRMFVPALPEDGVYALRPTAEAIEDVWRGFTFYADGHRALPPWVSVAGVVLPFTLGGLLIRQRSAQTARALDATWPWVYASGTAAVVFLVAVTQLFLHDRTPFLLVSWMPYRLLNHMPFVTAALVMTALATATSRSLSTQLGMVALAAALSPHLGRLIGGDWMGRYIGGGDGVLFFLFGMALGTLILVSDGRQRVWCVAGLVASVVLVATAHRFGAVCVAAGAFVPGLLSRLGRPAALGVRAAVVIASAPVLIHATMSWRAGMFQGPQLPSQLESVRAALSAVAAPVDLVIGPPNSHTLQSRLGQPVHSDAVMLSLISYNRRLGPLIERMFEDGYGISVARSKQGMDSFHWTEMWKERSLTEWTTFGAQYGVRFVLAPPEAQPLNLPVLDTNGDGMRDVLYQIPRWGKE